ncbi:MAG: hypothetical protein NW700_15410, partial [Nitrospiraceae bacterium]
AGRRDAQAADHSQCDGTSWDSMATGRCTESLTFKTVAWSFAAALARLAWRLGGFVTNRHE